MHQVFRVPYTCQPGYLYRKKARVDELFEIKPVKMKIRQAKRKKWLCRRANLRQS